MEICYARTEPEQGRIGAMTGMIHKLMAASEAVICFLVVAGAVVFVIEIVLLGIALVVRKQDIRNCEIAAAESGRGCDGGSDQGK